jgi:hypothetical protein
LGFGAFRSAVGETLSARSIAEPSDGSTKRSGDARASPRAASNKTVVAAPFCLVSERPTTRRRDGGSFGVTAEPVSKTGSALWVKSRVVAFVAFVTLRSERENVVLRRVGARRAAVAGLRPSAGGAVAGLATGMGFCPVACAVATSA